MKNNLIKKLIKYSGYIVGGIINGVIMLIIFYGLKLIGGNTALSIFIGAFIAYPIASISKKYYVYCIFKFCKRRKK